MREKDVFKNVVENNLASKESIRNRVISTVQIKSREGANHMKKKLLLTSVLVVVVATMSISVYATVNTIEYNKADSFLGEIGIQASNLSKSEAKKVYNDIKSDSFECETTKAVLSARANEVGIENVPSNAKEIYQEIVNYNGLVYTAKITSSQISAIKTGLSYKEIIEILGNTKDVGSGLHVLLYAVDGDKILYLNFGNENDICNLSGDELLKTLKDAKQDNSDENTFNATLTQRSGNSILVSCPNFKNFDVISLTITDQTVIVFENGTKASIDDIKDELIITISPEIRESYPPQGTAVKIIIK